MRSDVKTLVDRYRIPGECDECAIEAAALATGYPDGIREACGNKGCRFYNPAYDEQDRAAALCAVTGHSWHTEGDGEYEAFYNRCEDCGAVDA